MVNVSEMTPEMLRELSFTDEQRKELAEARKKPVIFDEDCPETTPERALKFRRVNQIHQEEMQCSEMLNGIEGVSVTPSFSVLLVWI